MEVFYHTFAFIEIRKCQSSIEILWWYNIYKQRTIETLGGAFMKVNIVGKNVTVTPAIAEKITKKLNVLTKYFIIDEQDTANVLIRTYPLKQKIEVTIPTKYAILRAEVVDDDLYAAIDLVIDKLKRILKKSLRPNLLYVKR